MMRVARPYAGPLLLLAVSVISGCIEATSRSPSALSGDLSGTQTSSVVVSVGGVSAANVANGASLANEASSTQDGTLVLRDGTGSFSAGTITASLNGNATTATAATTALSAAQATFALGLQGTSVASAATPTLPTSTGNFFSITGTTNISGFAAPANAGTRVTLSFAGVLTLQHATGASPRLLLQGLGPFTTVADDIFELVYDGTDWREVRRTVTNDSFVSVRLVGVQSIPTGALTTISFDTQDTDTQDEITIPGSTFTASQAGVYSVTSGVTFAAPGTNWAAGEFCQVAIVANGTLIGSTGGGSYMPDGTTALCTATASAVVSLAPAQTIVARTFQSNTGAVDAGPGTFLRIARIK